MENPIKPTWKTEILPVAVIVLSAIASVYFYQHFPARVVTHWDFAGRPNGWSGPAFAAFFFPAIILGIYLLLLVLPCVDPRSERYADFRKVYHIVKDAIVVLFAGLYFMTGLSGLGKHVPIQVIVPVGIGILFMIIGNYMGKLRRNWWIGIRTPWTMSNEQVWNKTHRLGGKMFLLAGVLFVLIGFVPQVGQVAIGVVFTCAIVAILVVPIVYSYVLFRKLGKSLD